MQSPGEASAQETVAVHEAGHLVVARHFQDARPYFGMRPALTAQIFRENTANGNITWRGDFNYLRFDVSPLQKTMIGVAGVIAVTLWRGNSVAELDWENPQTMSTKDWNECGWTPGKPGPELGEVVSTVTALLARDTGLLWPALRQTITRLIEDHVVSL
jgi:hypothetical protein